MPLSAADIDSLRGSFGDPPVSQVAGVNAIASTLMRNQLLVSNVSLGSSGSLNMMAINLPGDTIVTNLTLVSGSIAEATGTHAWMALYTGDLRLMAQSTDDTAAAAIGANTLYTKALSTPQRTNYSGVYYVGISVTATTMPTACGQTQVNSPGLNGITPILAGTTGAALAGAAPNPAAALTANQNMILMLVS